MDDTRPTGRAAEQVAGYIRNAIVRGELTPNDSLPPEAKLMELFSVSRPTLREAVRILEGENLIRVSRGPRGGAKVRPFTPDPAARAIGQTLQASHTRLEDIFNARRMIEPSAAGMAAATNPIQASLALRKQIIAEYKSLAEPPSRRAHSMSAFHILIVEVSGNRTLALIGRALQQIILTHVNLLDFSGLTPEQLDLREAHARDALQSHERLADLIEEGDSVGAEAHWRAHMDRLIPLWLEGHEDELLDVLEQVDKPIDWRSA